MKYPTLIVILLSLFALTSCDKEFIAPTGNTISTNQAIQSIDGLEVSGPFEVHINFSDTNHNLTFDGDEQYIDKVIVEEKGNTLKIRLAKNIVLKNDASIKVYLTSKEITKYAGTGEAVFLIEDELESKEIDLFLTGESAFTATIMTEELSIASTGESTIAITGTANTTDVSLTGAAKFKDFDFECKDLNIQLSGESQASVTIQERLNVVATGESVLNYKGSPNEINKVVTGAAKVRKVQ